MKRRRRGLLVLLSTLPFGVPASGAKPWPAATVRLVVPFPPGGGTDLLARMLADKLAPRLGQPVVVDNKPGGSTVIGAAAVAKAEPDGHTLLVSGSTTFSVNPALRPKLPYDPLRDLAPVAIVARAPLVLVVNSRSPWRALPDLLAAAKASPRGIDYATFGNGSAPHLAGSLLALAAGVRLQDIPYKGSAPALTGLIAGEIQMGIDTVAAAAPHVRAGSLRALAIVGSTRSSVLPDVPTVAASGWPDASFDAWYGIAAPGGTPAHVLQGLQRDLGGLLADGDMQAKLRAHALEPVHLGPAEFSRQMEAEIARYRALAHRAHIVAE